MARAKPVPDGYHTVTPYLTVKGAAALLDFLVRAFDAREHQRTVRADGTIGHAETRLGDSMIMVSEASDQWPARPGALFLYVKDVDQTYAAALAAGAHSIMAPVDTNHGDRQAGVTDVFGNTWWIGTPIEDVSKEEMARRAAAAR